MNEERDMSEDYSGKRTEQEFEGLGVYKKARELTNGIYAVTRQPAFARDASLVDQIRRAAVSVVSHIAAGYERGNKQGFVQSLHDAKGACGEVRAQLGVALDQRDLTAQDCGLMTEQCLLVGRMLDDFIEHLHDSAKPEQRQHSPRRETVSADEEWQRVISELAEQRKRRDG
jgi:four helix bundle protein